MYAVRFKFLILLSYLFKGLCKILYPLLLDSIKTMFRRVDNTEETIEGKSLICIYDSGLFIQLNVT